MSTDLAPGKKRILALSDFGNTGISESLSQQLIHWHNDGHEISHLALGFNGWQQGVDRTRYPWWERLLPIFGAGSDKDRFGQRQIEKALRLTGAEVIISSFDVWMVNYLAQPERHELDPATMDILNHDKRTFKHIAYFPLDGATAGNHLPNGMDEMIMGFDVPVTYSKFAQSIVMRDTSVHIPFIPIAHDPSVYYPHAKKKARQALGLPEDRFIVAMVATNQYRKAWGEFFAGVVPFARLHEDVLVVPFTGWQNKIMGGTEIEHLVYRSGLDGQIFDPSGLVGGLSDEGMAKFYSACDVVVLTTIGEGAGLPPIRARACGTPTLVSDNTSNTEFCGHEFELLPTSGSFLDPFGSNLQRYITEPGALESKLERYYNEPFLRRQVAAAGRSHVAAYEIDKIMPMWDAILEAV